MSNEINLREIENRKPDMLVVLPRTLFMNFKGSGLCKQRVDCRQPMLTLYCLKLSLYQ